jgi:calcium-dependent protein kinase
MCVVKTTVKEDNIDLTFSNVKVIDFGFARLSAPTQGGRSQQRLSAVGTLYYASPQVLRTPSQVYYTKKCDLWSVGVITYMLLCGSPPFEGQTDEETRDLISRGQPNFQHPNMEALSGSAKDLLRKLLCADESKRLTAEEALRHEFFAGMEPGSQR